MADGGAGPRIVGRYALFDAIASGGMASVHLGRLMGPVGFSRTVAIKRLHETFATDPEFVAMFMDEARLAARIRHPNVVPTLDVVALERELLLVMEYVSGESLSLLLKRARTEKRPTPIPVVVDILIDTLSGLHAAHEATNEKGEPLDIVHRDVSPQNILVGTDGVARLLDFGVAKAVGRMHETRAGQVKGKIRYMAPEQITGKGVTRTADIYAASIVLWEAVTGKRLFTGDTDAEVMFRVLEGKVDPPSRHRPDVPRALDEIILRGLSPKPSDRFATAQEMATALEGAVAAVARGAVVAWVVENASDAILKRKKHVAFVESAGAIEAGAPVEKSDVAESSASLTAPSVEKPVTASRAAWPVPEKRRAWTAMAIVCATAFAISLGVSALSRGAREPPVAAVAAVFAIPPFPTLEAPAAPTAPVDVDAPLPTSAPTAVPAAPPSTKRASLSAAPARLAPPRAPADRLYRRD